MATKMLTKLPCPVARPDRTGTRNFESLIEEIANTTNSSATPPRPTDGEGLVGRCIDDRHPTLAGRVLVRWEEDDGEVEKWVPTLQQVSVRVHDRVLLMRPANFDEPVVTGVLDGFTRRPEPDRQTAASLELKRDEAVHVAGSHGEPLLELYQDDAGPVVRLLREDIDVEFPGMLRMSAARIELEATRGSVDIEASDDVNVDGELINLNC